MENLDFFKEKILQIEDYTQVDENLMSKISSNPEYLNLFKECKTLSDLIRDSVPSPTQNEVTLSDSVIKKIQNGDTAPKYINSHSFRFPFATVACLLIVCAVMFTSRYLPDKYSKNHDAQNNMAAESYSDEESLYDAKIVKNKQDSALVLDVTESGNSNTALDSNTYFYAQSEASDDNSINYRCLEFEESKTQESMPTSEEVTEEESVSFNSFSYKADFEIYTQDTAGVKTDGFKNISVNPIIEKDEAVVLAKNECSISYDTTQVWFDPEKDIWKVLFMTEGVIGNCQTVYIDSCGITQLVVYGE